MARLQQAPDANVVEYMKINLEQIAQAQASGDDVCFRFLFPAVKGGINPVKVISHEVLARRTESDARMMRAAYGPNKHTVTPQEKQPGAGGYAGYWPGAGTALRAGYRHHVRSEQRCRQRESGLWTGAGFLVAGSGAAGSECRGRRSFSAIA
ncbi:Uncharacterised protein [Kluyvera cryocrescens]|uniref:Uncharacterized protein n=1 Tax=Kluyvera cryocrescens TaxID=580 RepID=A0A485BCP9_KLUCR|nr:Uncharacterised protein [Kluyvera cryocrescens]